MTKIHHFVGSAAFFWKVIVSELENSRWIVPAKLTNALDLYVHRGLDYSATRAFTDIFLQLNLTDSDTYDLYKVGFL